MAQSYQSRRREAEDQYDVFSFHKSNHLFASIVVYRLRERSFTS